MSAFDNKRKLLLFLVVLLAVFAVYRHTPGSWFHGDDFNHYFLGITHASARGVVALFFPPAGSGYYRPLDKALDVFQFAVFGDKALLHHVLSLVLYAANILLLMVLVVELGGGAPTTFLSAALFFLMPIHVEPVAWAVNRNMLFSALFYLLSMRYLLAALRDGGLRAAGWAAACFVPCVMFYEGGFSLILIWPVVAASEILRRRREWKTLLRASFAVLSIPLAVCTAYALFYFIYLKAGYPIHIGRTFSWHLNAYLRDMTLPYHHTQFFDAVFGYPLLARNPDTVLRSATELAAWSVAGLLLVAAARNTTALLGFLWMFAGLSPFLTVYSERYSYFASFGFCLLVASGIVGATRRFRRPLPRATFATVAVIAFIAIFIFYSGMVGRRTEVWKWAGERNRAQLSELNREIGAPVPGRVIAVVAPPTDFYGVPGVTFLASALYAVHGRTRERIEAIRNIATMKDVEDRLRLLRRSSGILTITGFCYNLPPQGRYADITRAFAFKPTFRQAEGTRIFLVPKPPTARLCLGCKQLLICTEKYFTR